MPTLPFLEQLLRARLTPEAAAWLAEARDEIGRGVDDARFCILVSLASRKVPRRALLAPSAEECRAADAALPGFLPERWTLLETVRVVLLLGHPGLAGDAGPRVVEEVFRYADQGECCATYKALAHLPEPARFQWRAQEGCRTNVLPIFESVVCDTPYPFRYFDDVAFRQAAVKCLFVGAPLWRMHGLDQRGDAELARMALDLVDERRAAGRTIPPDLWLLLGAHGGERGAAALRAECDPANPHAAGREAAAIALARAGLPGDHQGPTGQDVFRRFDPRHAE